MKVKLLKHWDDARSSYWFVPSLMALAAIALSFATTSLDAAVGTAWLERIDWLHANQPAGARDLLSTIAGSMITVAGVAFSITIAAVAYASSQYGPRLLTNFMRDRGNQVTLGAFIATFLYCLLVLRTIRAPGLSEAAALSEAFVPQISVFCGVLFAIANIGVLIYFIHHVPESIHIVNVVAGVGRALNDRISTLFPEMIGQAAPDADGYDPRSDIPDGFFEEATPIGADGSGFLQQIDEKGLLRAATEHDLLLRVRYRPGDFVSGEKVLVLAWPARRVDQAVTNQIKETFALGRQRTPRQDLLFLINELVEIIGRALSPAINEPFTANACLDWLGSALVNLARRDLPGAFRYDEEKRLRVITRPITFEACAEAAFESPRPYVEADRNAALHMIKILAEVLCHVETPAYRQALLRHARHLKAGCAQQLEHQTDLDAIEQRYRVFLQLLRAPEGARALADEHAWLDGSG